MSTSISTDILNSIAIPTTISTATGPIPRGAGAKVARVIGNTTAATARVSTTTVPMSHKNTVLARVPTGSQVTRPAAIRRQRPRTGQLAVHRQGTAARHPPDPAASTANRSANTGSASRNPSGTNRSSPTTNRSTGSSSAFSGSRSPSTDRMSSSRGASSRGATSYGGSRGGASRGGGRRR